MLSFWEFDLNWFIDAYTSIKSSKCYPHLSFLTVSHLKPVIYICHGSENGNYYIATHATTEDISLNQWNSLS